MHIFGQTTLKHFPRAEQGRFLSSAFWSVSLFILFFYGIFPFLSGNASMFLRVLPQQVFPLLTVLALAWHFKQEKSVCDMLAIRKMNPFPYRLFTGFLTFLYVFTLILSNAVQKIGTALDIPLPPQSLVAELLKTDPVSFALLAFSAVILAPVTEEILFRQIIFSKLSYHVPEQISAILTAILFSLLHGSLLQALPLFFMSLILQSAYRNTGSLVMPILLHSCFNLISIILLITIKFF